VPGLLNIDERLILNASSAKNTIMNRYGKIAGLILLNKLSFMKILHETKRRKMSYKKTTIVI
jgi:hypothetical protein